MVASTSSSDTEMMKRLKEIKFPKHDAEKWGQIFTEGLSAEETKDFRDMPAIGYALNRAIDEMSVLSTQYLEQIIGILGSVIKEQEDRIYEIRTTGKDGVGRKPKLPDPPVFNGAGGDMKFGEWVDKVQLWISYENVVSDRHKIILTTLRMSGAASKYVTSWTRKAADTTKLVSYNSFITELKQIYGQRDEQDGAKKEFNELCRNEDFTHRNFIKFAERFRTLAKLCEHPSSHIIDRLEKMLDKEMRISIATWKIEKEIPKEWV